MKDGGPAFPAPAAPGVYTPTGMTLRDWFAGQAMRRTVTSAAGTPKEMAEWAYRCADAMLKAREGQ